MVTVVKILLLLLAGGASGLASGLLEVGGGVLLVPFLLLYFQATGVSSLVTAHLAFGTGLLATVGASAVTASRFSRSKQVLWDTLPVTGSAAVAGAALGAIVAAGLQERSLRSIAALVILLAAVRLLARPQKPKTHGEEKRIVPLGGVGLLSGLLGSLSGVGGEVIILPLLYRYLHVPLMRARGTSGAVLTASSLCGAFVYAATGWGNVILPPSSLGYVDGFCALPLLAGTALGVAFSMRLEARAATPVVRRVVAALLLILAFIVALA